MKLLRTMLLCLLLVTCVSAKPQFQLPQLDLKQTIEILADYSLRHQEVIAGGQWWGLTDYRKKVMYISDEPDAAVRRLTVLHELIHAAYYQRGVDTSGPEGEAAVDAMAHDLFQRMWGLSQEAK